VGSAVQQGSRSRPFSRGAIGAADRPALEPTRQSYPSMVASEGRARSSGPTQRLVRGTVRANPSARSQDQGISGGRRALASTFVPTLDERPQHSSTRHARAWSRPCSRAQGEPFASSDCPGQSRSELRSSRDSIRSGISKVEALLKPSARERRDRGDLLERHVGEHRR